MPYKLKLPHGQSMTVMGEEELSVGQLFAVLIASGEVYQNVYEELTQRPEWKKRLKNTCGVAATKMKSANNHLAKHSDFIWQEGIMGDAESPFQQQVNRLTGILTETIAMEPKKMNGLLTHMAGLIEEIKNEKK